MITPRKLVMLTTKGKRNWTKKSDIEKTLILILADIEKNNRSALTAAMKRVLQPERDRLIKAWTAIYETVVDMADTEGTTETTETKDTQIPAQNAEEDVVSINEDIYQRTLRLKSSGVLSGQFDQDVEVGDESVPLPWDCDLVKAFLADDDIQEMTITSTCIGFTKTLTKQYKR